MVEYFKLLLIINPLNPELNPICHLLALLGVHHFLHVSRIRVKELILCMLHYVKLITLYLCICNICNICFWYCTMCVMQLINTLKTELNPICYLLALLAAHHFIHVSRIRVKLLTYRLLMSYIYGPPILDVSRSHTTTQHSR